MSVSVLRRSFFAATPALLPCSSTSAGTLVLDLLPSKLPSPNLSIDMPFLALELADADDPLAAAAAEEVLMGVGILLEVRRW